MKNILIVSLIAFSLAFLGCSSSKETSKEQASKMIKTESGLQYEDIRLGSGDAVKSGQKLTVHYEGTLSDGTKFDNSYDRNQPFEFVIGKGQVIKGWEEGLLGMRIGGKRKLIIPAELGYGANSAGAIPANSELIFEIELLDAK